jgi:hypothetical protein
MNCMLNRKAVNPCRITRGFSFSRIGGEFLASAYEVILPVFRHRITGFETGEGEQTYSLTTKQPLVSMEAGR